MTVKLRSETRETVILQTLDLGGRVVISDKGNSKGEGPRIRLSLT